MQNQTETNQQRVRIETDSLKQRVRIDTKSEESDGSKGLSKARSLSKGVAADGKISIKNLIGQR